MQGYFHLEDDTKEHYNEERIPKERLDLHNILHIECDMENKSENGFIMIQLFMNPVSTLSSMYEFKMVTYLFVKSAEQLESHICPIERRLALFRFGYAWDCVAVDGNIGRGRCPEIVGLNN